MNALRRQNSRPQQTFERWMPRTHESPRELACQSEAKRKQVPQSEANVCQRWRRMQSRKNLPYYLHRTPNNAQNTQHKSGVAFEVQERNNYKIIKNNFFCIYFWFVRGKKCPFQSELQPAGSSCQFFNFI